MKRCSKCACARAGRSASAKRPCRRASRWPPRSICARTASRSTSTASGSMRDGAGRRPPSWRASAARRVAAQAGLQAMRDALREGITCEELRAIVRAGGRAARRARGVQRRPRPADRDRARPGLRSDPAGRAGDPRPRAAGPRDRHVLRHRAHVRGRRARPGDRPLAHARGRGPGGRDRPRQAGRRGPRALRARLRSLRGRGLRHAAQARPIRHGGLPDRARARRRPRDPRGAEPRTLRRSVPSRET